jgi:hypothetical protein
LGGAPFLFHAGSHFINLFRHLAALALLADQSRPKHNNQNQIITMSRLSIIGAKDAGNITVDLQFSDQTTRRVDIGDFIRRHPHPQYNKYLNPRNFRRFEIENGNIVWGKSWDLVFPVEQLHSGVIEG